MGHVGLGGWVDNECVFTEGEGPLKDGEMVCQRGRCLNCHQPGEDTEEEGFQW